MPRPTSAPESRAPAMRVVLVTMDSHGRSAGRPRCAITLPREIPGLTLSVHAASEWGRRRSRPLRRRSPRRHPSSRCCSWRITSCRCHRCCCAPARPVRRDGLRHVGRRGDEAQTRMGRFSMDGEATGMTALLKGLRSGCRQGRDRGRDQGQRRCAADGLLRRLPQILRFIPGTAQDLRAYFLVLQYWLAGSQDNVADLVRLLVAAMPPARAALRDLARPARRSSIPRSASTTRACRRPARRRGSDCCRTAASAAPRARSACC